MAEKELRGIVRIGEVDVRGEKAIGIALLKIKGVGQSLAPIVVKLAGLDPKMKAGELTDEQAAKINQIIKDPIAAGIPDYFINRRKDPVTGEDKHYVTSELRFVLKNDIDLMRKIRCYRGIRHERGLPCRGQRTRGSFRKSGKALGVARKKPGKK